MDRFVSGVIIVDKVTGSVIYSSLVPEIVSSVVRFSVHRRLSQTPPLLMLFYTLKNETFAGFEQWVLVKKGTHFNLVKKFLL
jgi:hypothetical protein